jgi:hypothetical protein
LAGTGGEGAMTAAIVNFTAARTARTLRQHAPPLWLDAFLAHMASTAREDHDPQREEFWQEVAVLLGRELPRLAL